MSSIEPARVEETKIPSKLCGEHVLHLDDHERISSAMGAFFQAKKIPHTSIVHKTQSFDELLKIIKDLDPAPTILLLDYRLADGCKSTDFIDYLLSTDPEVLRGKSILFMTMSSQTQSFITDHDRINKALSSAGLNTAMVVDKSAPLAVLQDALINVRFPAT